MTLNLPHLDPFGIGPFCRLRVQTTAPQEPGGYAWVVDGRVHYVGKAVEGFGLIQKVKGQRLGRARSPPVLQLPLDCTYCRTSTGGAMTRVLGRLPTSQRSPAHRAGSRRAEHHVLGFVEVLPMPMAASHQASGVAKR